MGRPPSLRGRSPRPRRASARGPGSSPGGGPGAPAGDPRGLGLFGGCARLTSAVPARPVYDGEMRPPPPPGIPGNAPSIAGGRYLVVSRIGEGGMAGVYRAWDERLRVWRAVKVLFPEYARKPSIRQRFAGEAHTMARLEHPNLVRIYDVGDAGPLPFLVMELVDGGTLQQWIHALGGMAPRLATQVLLDLTDAVGATHAAGVIHRDIKPHNVLISTSGRCKLTDFGIAHDRANDLTQTGMVMGTLGYMAPEQRRNAKTVDHRADIYALGSTLWTLLSGETAHDLFNAPVDPSLLEPLPAPLRPIILRSCAYARTERYPDTASLELALRGALEALPPDPEGSPTLLADLHHEEPQEELPRFPELQALLDTGVSSLDETPRSAPKQPLPYFMPRPPPGQVRRGGVPDYLDEPPDREEGGIAIRADVAHICEDLPPTPPPSPTFGSLPPEPRDLPLARRPMPPITA
ncbi:MAG TPA: serine/threonine protein kinase, partial [Deltaproteobacteria bacterium]|nr:serine/threonine protein kinase [Deltaproteobacteria bacterium]